MVTDRMTGTLLIVGFPGQVHVGGHLQRAAESLGLRVIVADVSDAFSGPVWARRLTWRLRDHRAPRMRQFTEQVVSTCEQARPNWLLATGMVPINAQALEAIGRLGIKRINYLTDDPWNPAHRSRWFFDALRHYDRVFSPRLANLDDLRTLGGADVNYLPFGYAPDVHFLPRDLDQSDPHGDGPDVVFAGGADGDRVPYLQALDEAGFSIRLYGGYWSRHPRLGRFARGLANPNELREATFSARIALCLPRRANRDGHVMRSFEIPATGACMLAEDTHEHREFFGADGAAVAYFRTAADLVERARWLLAHANEQARLRGQAHMLVTTGRHTYLDRLRVMLGHVEAGTVRASEGIRA